MLRSWLIAARPQLDGHRGYAAIQELPGIGPVLDAVIIAEIGDVRRLARPAKLCSWAGLTPRHRESDTKVRRGYVTKQGPRQLRWALCEAVQHSPRGSAPGSSRTRSSPAAAARCSILSCWQSVTLRLRLGLSLCRALAAGPSRPCCLSSGRT